MSVAAIGYDNVRSAIKNAYEEYRGPEINPATMQIFQENLLAHIAYCPACQICDMEDLVTHAAECPECRAQLDSTLSRFHPRNAVVRLAVHHFLTLYEDQASATIRSAVHHYLALGKAQPSEVILR